MSAARSKRQSIPKMDTQVEVPTDDTNKPSIWARIKTAAQKTMTVVANASKKTAAVIAKPFKAAAKKVAPPIKSAAKKMACWARLVAYRVKHAVRPVTNFLEKLWHRALKPMCQFVLLTTAVTVGFICAYLAPLATVLTLIVAAGVFFLLASAVSSTDEIRQALPLIPRERWFVRAVARASLAFVWGIEALARLLRVAAYAGSLLLLGLMCATSASFAFFMLTFVVLSYLQVKGASTIAFYAWCVVTGNWGTLLVFALFDTTVLMTRATRVTRTATPTATVPERTEASASRESSRSIVLDAEIVVEDAVRVVTPSDAPGQPHLWTRGNFLRAKGTEELWGTVHDVAPVSAPDWAEQWDASTPCNACDEPKGGLRVTTDGPIDTHGLCGACFDLQCEEDALRFTGVSLKARSLQVQLNATGIASTPEYSASKFNNNALHWLTTAWWRDRSGKSFEREWSCLHDGNVVAAVRHNYKRNVYLVTVLGKTVSSTKTTLGAAKRLASDTINDEGNAVSRMVETLGDLADNIGEKLVPPLLFPGTKKG
jgi:hypothetical protein